MDAEGNCSLEVPDQSVQHILEQVHHRDKMIPVDVKNTHSFTFPHRFQLLPLSQLKSQTFSNAVPTIFKLCESKFVSNTVVEYIRDVIFVLVNSRS